MASFICKISKTIKIRSSVKIAYFLMSNTTANFTTTMILWPNKFAWILMKQIENNF